MKKEERKKLKRELAESFEQFEQAVNDWIENPNEHNLERLRKADEEYKSLNKKLWDWLDMQKDNSVLNMADLPPFLHSDLFK